MSKQYDNTNRFALFKNDRPNSENSPQYTGKINVEGVEYYLNAWIKEGKKGKFFSGSAKRVDETAKKGLQEARKAIDPTQEGFDDDIPF